MLLYADIWFQFSEQLYLFSFNLLFIIMAERGGVNSDQGNDHAQGDSSGGGLRKFRMDREEAVKQQGSFLNYLELCRPVTETNAEEEPLFD